MPSTRCPEPSANARAMRSPTSAVAGRWNAFRSIDGSRFDPPAPRTPVDTRAVLGVLPVSVAV